MIEDYLKDGETPEACIERNRSDVQKTLLLLSAERKKTERMEGVLREVLCLQRLGGVSQQAKTVIDDLLESAWDALDYVQGLERAS